MRMAHGPTAKRLLTADGLMVLETSLACPFRIAGVAGKAARLNSSVMSARHSGRAGGYTRTGQAASWQFLGWTNVCDPLGCDLHKVQHATQRADMEMRWYCFGGMQAGIILPSAQSIPFPVNCLSRIGLPIRDVMLRVKTSF